MIIVAAPKAEGDAIRPTIKVSRSAGNFERIFFIAYS
jgi:hypothetical protein